MYNVIYVCSEVILNNKIYMLMYMCNYVVAIIMCSVTLFTYVSARVCDEHTLFLLTYIITTNYIYMCVCVSFKSYIATYCILPLRSYKLLAYIVNCS